jgi:ADP-ribose pyrophosphatase YjhB (NUDIX family)
MSSPAAIIGRFQVPEPHIGHQRLFNEVMMRHRVPNITVLLGCSPGWFNPRYPFTFTQRVEMLERYLPGARFRSLIDCRTDEEWSQQVDDILEPGTIIYGGRDCFAPHYTGTNPVIVLPIDSPRSGTMIRAENTTERLQNEDQRIGWLRAMQTLGRDDCALTVDIACFRNNHLVVIKKSGEPKWRLPGGFFDSAVDGTIENAAFREMREETKIDMLNVNYVASRSINDWRYRGTDYKIITALFTGNADRNAPFTAADDAAEIGLLPTNAIYLGDFMEEHQVLIEVLLHRGLVTSAKR